MSSFEETQEAPPLEGQAETVRSQGGRGETVAPERGTTIGRYVILETLGAGGSGVVVSAYDPELDRKVAVKLVHSSRQHRERARPRLLREAQALAKLAHPNVVAVHDVGLHQGQVFVAMEYVRGKTLADWMKEGHGWREVVRVFTAAAKGLAAAHEVELVHRDFKPENVMMGDRGRVRVMDFGLARSETERRTILPGGVSEHRDPKAFSGSLTQTGALMGTPAYMSPEQFMAMPADARSDQFSFCVAMYEALYGERPHTGGSMAELSAAVTRGKIGPVPKGSSVPTWLRRVLLRGLAVDPDERWEDMEAVLAALADDPAIKRRRLLGGVGLVGSLGLAGWGALGSGAEPTVAADPCADAGRPFAGVWDEERRGRVQRSIVATDVSHAKTTAAKVAASLDHYADEWRAARRDACEATHVRGEQSESMLDRRMVCLHDRRRDLEAMVDVLLETDDAVVEEAARAAAELPAIEACADLRALQASIPLPADQQERATALELEAELATIRALANGARREEAEARVGPVLERARTLGYEPTLARALLRHGVLLEEAGRYEAGERELETAFFLAEKLGMRGVAAEAATVLVRLVGFELGRYEEALRWGHHAEMLAFGEPRLTGRLLGNTGTIRRERGEFELARRLYERSLEAARESGDRNGLAHAQNTLGYLAMNQARYDEAAERFHKALDGWVELLGPEHRLSTYPLSNLAQLELLRGNLADARRYQERALLLWNAAVGPDHPAGAEDHLTLGRIAMAEGKADEARAEFERSIAMSGSDTVDFADADAREHLGDLLVATGEFTAARAEHERALDARIRTHGDGHPKVAHSLRDLSELDRLEGDLDRALERASRALMIWQQKLDAGHPDVVAGRTAVAAVHLDAERWTEARAVIEPVRAALENPKVVGIVAADARSALARALWETRSAGDDPARVHALAREALDGYRASPLHSRSRNALVRWRSGLDSPARSRAREP